MYTLQKAFITFSASLKMNILKICKVAKANNSKVRGSLKKFYKADYQQMITNKKVNIYNI